MKGFQTGLKEACATLVERVMETVRYYGTQPSGSAVDRVYLCGGMTRAKGVADTLLHLPVGEVTLWDPLSMLPCARTVRKHEASTHGLAFAVALGLAMRSARDVQN
jgi:Tfp pilus assembly PilM family ATPase